MIIDGSNIGSMQDEISSSRVGTNLDRFETCADRKAAKKLISIIIISPLIALLSMRVGTPLINSILFLVPMFIAIEIYRARLLLRRSSICAREIDRSMVRLIRRDGQHVELVKNILISFSPIGPRTAATLAGKDSSGKRQQYLLFQGNFSDDATFAAVVTSLQLHTAPVR